MMAASRRSEMKLWTAPEENRLLVWSILGKSIADWARANGRKPGGVRMKLMRLRADPALRPPELSEQPNAAAPRVKVACGPADTPDGT